LKGYFDDKLGQLDWSNILNTDDVNMAYKKFHKKFTDVYNETCPVVKLKLRRKNHKPWITASLSNACKKKNLLYKQFLKYRTEESQLKYKNYKNRLTSILRSSEKLYYADKLVKYKNDLKMTWRTLNEITQRKKKKKSNVNEFKSEDNIITDDKEIANCFVNFFTNIGPKLAEKIDKCPGRNYSNFLSNSVVNSMYLSPVTEDEIIKIVSKFRNKTSCGYDDMNMTVVKQIIVSIVQPLKHICNRSFETGIFPNDMKIAKIIPLFKSGDRKEFSNYRPVSILPQFSKIQEKLFYNRLISFVKDNNIMYNGQYGFRENHSTALALMELIEEITSNLDNKLVTTGVFIDLKKAFDTIDHSILIRKLCHYGVRGIASSWIKDYLSNRSQFFVYNGMSSERKILFAEYHRLLYLDLYYLYINDLANVSHELKFILFADDTNVFYTGKNIKDVSKVLNEELKHLSEWFKVNKLSLNVKKNKLHDI